MSAKIALQDPSIFRSIKNGTPGFKLTDAIGRFLGVKFSHAPLIDVLTAAHRVGEMHFPIVALIDIGEGSCDSTFGHDRVRFAKQ